MEERSSKASIWEKISRRKNVPETDEEFKELLTQAKDNDFLDLDTFNLMLNSLVFKELEVRDVMVTYSQMQVIHIEDSIEKIIEIAIKTSHSRFPVIANDKDEVVGILHVKDLLKFYLNPESFDLKMVLREVVYVSESKLLHTLIKEFREKHNHLAVVVDEYGGVSGLITLEDAFEQIFGDIEDEFDIEENQDNIVQISENNYLVNAVTELTEFNEYFSTDFTAEEVDTIGGLVISLLGYMPSKGESIEEKGFKFQVEKVGRRRIVTLKVTILANNNEE